MLINNWYVAAESDEIKVGEPYGVRMLGLDFALHRLEDGSVVCMPDTCIHRGASLSRGSCKGENIACPFHGWEFAPDGQCVAIPSMGKDVKIPKRARVDIYPTEERYGYVWAFLGDLAEDERPPLPALLPEYEETDAWRTTRMVNHAPVNWQKFEENSLDTAHLSFVHKAFGSRLDPKATIVPIERTDFGAKVARERTAPKADQKSGVLGELLKEDRKKTSVELEFSLVGTCHRIKPTFRPGMSQVAYASSTPITPYETRQFSLQARNYAIEPEHDAERLAGRAQAVEEDLGVSTYVRPAIGPTPFKDEFLVKADEMETIFRGLVMKMVDAGWEIDYQKVKDDWDHKIYVIPSPGRKENPVGWIHEAVPTTRPRTDVNMWEEIAKETGKRTRTPAQIDPEVEAAE